MTGVALFTFICIDRKNVICSMKKSGLILYSILINFLCIAQHTEQKDSLLHLLKTAKEDTNKVFLLLQAGELYENAQPETAKQYYTQALGLSKKLYFTKGEIKFASYYTAVLNIQGKFDSALLLNRKAMALAKESGDQVAIMKTTFNTANSFAHIEKNDSAIYYYMQVLPMLEKMDDKRMLSVAYNAIQNAYVNQLRYDKAIEYGKKSLVLHRNGLDDPLSKAYTLSNLGMSYSNLFKFDSAIIFFGEAFSLTHKMGDLNGESAVLLNMGEVYFQTGKLELAKQYFTQALQIAGKSDLSEPRTIALKGLAMFYLHTKKYETAHTLADSALTIALKNGDRRQSLKIYKLLADISYANQDFTAASDYDKKQDQMSDSISNDNVQKISTEYEIKYETQKKEAQIKLQQAELKQKNSLNYFLIAGSSALLLIILLGYFNYRNRQHLQQVKIDELETEKQLTATEAVLKGEEQERTRLAKDLHDGLGGMLSSIKYSLSNMKENLIMTHDNAQAFERSIDMLDSSIKEMRRVAHNMMPEILVKYGLDTALKEFCEEIDRSGVIHARYLSIGMGHTTIEQTTAVTIYRIVQELLNNVIKHANAKNVLVQVHATEEDKLLAVTVEDDGKGFDVALVKQGKGMGWRNIENRVEFLKGKIDIDSEENKGTSVLIELSL